MFIFPQSSKIVLKSYKNIAEIKVFASFFLNQTEILKQSMFYGLEL